MSRLRDLLAGGKCLVADGAMGTMLIERGLRSGACPEEINLERPEVPAEVARLYALAGSDIVQANTFGASPLKLAHWGLAGRAEAINRAAVRAARGGVPTSTLVAASVGPTGRLLEPYGDTPPGEVLEAFRVQLAALTSEGVDLIIIETMTDLAEALLALRAAREVAGEAPVAVTLTFEPTPSGYRTIMGTTVQQAVQALTADGVDLLGSNCGLGSESMVEVAREFRRHTQLPLLFQPNAGLPRLEGDQAVYPESPDTMAMHARELLRCGVNILGGCCGTTPAHIRALRAAVQSAHLSAT